MKDRVRLEIKEHVADVMLDRADKMNAIDIRMFEALGEAADAIAADSTVRAVVLHGDGGNFCAGIDLGVLGAKDIDFGRAISTPILPSPANLFQRAAYAWRELDVPVIAALEGATLGGGLQIAMGADIRYASPDLRMSIMEAKWGLVPDMAITTTLRDVLPADRVKELAWSARVFGADEALKLGLVTDISDDPFAAATRFAKSCAAASPDAIRGIKKLVNSGWRLSEAESLGLEARLQAGIMGGRNQAEAVRANLEKRAPEFED